MQYQTGKIIWLGNTPATPGMGGDAAYRAVAIQDSLAIYGGATGVGYGHAYMYCVRKRNGTGVWQNLVDSISYDLPDFTSIPYIAGGNVVTLTRNANGHTQIVAYDPVTGNKLWATADNDNLQARFLIGNNAFYIVNGQSAFAYSAKDGSLLWQTDLGSSGNSTANCFLDGNKLIVPNAASNTSCTVSVYSTTNGSLLSSHSFTLMTSQTNYFTYNYGNNILYATDLEMGDSITLHAYDINAQKEKWTYKYQEAGQYGNIVTPDFVIVPEAIGTTQSDVTFLNVQGSVVKKVPFASNYIQEFLYTDTTGAVYSQP